MRKNKALSIILALVLSAGLIPYALSASVSAEGAVINVKTEAEFQAALNMNTKVARINVTDSFTVYGECVILYDAAHIDNYCDTVVDVNAGAVITVENGGVVGSFWPSYEGNWETPPLPEGEFKNNGVIIVEDGGSVAAGFDVNNGSVTVKDGGFVTCPEINNGTVNVYSGGIYMTPQGLNVYNYGKIDVQPGGLMSSRFGSAIINAESGSILLNGDFYCACMGEDMLFENHGDVSGFGSVFLQESDPSFAPVPDMDALIEEMMGYLGQTSRFDDWGDINIYKVVNISSYEELAAATTGERIVAGEPVEGDLDTRLTIVEDLIIPEGSYIATMALISVPEEVSLTVSSNALLEAGINNRGRIDVLPEGLLLTTMGSYIENNGVLNVEEGALLVSQMGSAVTNGESGKMKLDGEFYCGCLNFGDGDVIWFNNYGKIDGRGDIVLYEVEPEGMPVDDMDGLIVEVMDMLGQTSRFDDWDDINIFKTVYVSSYKELAAATTGERIVAGEHVEGDMDTLLSLNGDITIPSGGSVLTMASMTVYEDYKLTVSGNAELECGIDNYGEIEVKSDGALMTTMGGSIVNYGVITVEENGSLVSQMGSSVINTPGARIILDGTFYCACLNYGEGDVFWFENHDGEIDGKGRLVLYEIDEMPVDDMNAVVIAAGEALGESNVTVSVESTFTPGDINGDGSVNNKDVVALFKYVSGGGTDVNIIALDVNGDGSVNNKDVVALFKYVSGGDVELSDKPYHAV